MLNIIEFVEAPVEKGGLGWSLYPVQKVVLKLLYGLPLSREPGEVEYFEPKVEEDSGQFGYTHYQWSEWGYVEWLHKQGRCNRAPGEGVGQEARELVLVCGRRSGKTLLSSLITAYELYRTFQHEDPQTRFGLPADNVIQFLLVGTSKDQAGYLFREAVDLIKMVPRLGRSVVSSTQSYLRMQTVADVRRYGAWSPEYNPDGRATIKLSGRSALGKGLRGAANKVVVLDELAFYPEHGVNSAEEVYNAVTPSTAVFSPKDAEGRVTGPNEGKIVCLSSPWLRQGLFYKLCVLGSNTALGRHMLCLQIPTWEMNPRVPMSEYDRYHARSPKMFWAEYGAQFQDKEPEVDIAPPSLQCPKCGHQY